MVGVDALDVGGDRLRPGGVTGALVLLFPRQDRGIVLPCEPRKRIDMVQQVGDVRLEIACEGGIVEVGARRVLPPCRIGAAGAGIPAHAVESFDERDDQPDPERARLGDEVVVAREYLVVPDSRARLETLRAADRSEGVDAYDI